LGEDDNGQFEVQRRYKEFFILRACLTERFPGFYVPPLPPKKKMVSGFIISRATLPQNSWRKDVFS
jgi:hypothetical protein